MRINIEPYKCRVVGCHVQYIIMCGKCVITAFLLCLTWSVCVDGWWRSSSKAKVSGARIQRIADSYIGSNKWAKSSSHTTGVNTNKCNIFVADVFKEAGVNVPRTLSRRWPIGAREWGNPKSLFLWVNSCWTNHRTGQIGDVIGGGGHVGIVTGYRQTTSAGTYKVLKNDWGYRSGGPKVTFWRYVC
ncbi:uncharacterized protein [Haliotis cracherodii]|uniref:uncharacterized protein n=1 Tax=Haliotis cracherodii TaxID=6455 RepID=UPI0039EA9FA5